MSIKFGFYLFSKKIFSSLLIVAQIVLTTIISILMILHISEVSSKNIYMNKFYNNEVFIHFSPQKQYNDSSFEYAKRLNYTEEDVSSNFFYKNIMLDNTKFTMLGYNDKFFDYFKPKLSKGTYIEDYNGVIPCYITKFNTSISIGDTFTQKINDISYTFEVYGIVSSESFYIKLSSTSNVLSSSNYIKSFKETFDQEKYEFIIFDSDLLNCNYKSIYNNEIIILDKNINDESFSTICDELKKIGFVNTKNSIVSVDTENIKNILKMYLPFTILLSLISLIGIVGVIILNVNDNHRNFSVLITIGATKKIIYKIIMVYTLSIILINLLICYIIIYSLINNNQIKYYQISYVILIPILYAIIYFLISLLYTSIILKNKEVILKLKDE